MRGEARGGEGIKGRVRVMRGKGEEEGKVGCCERGREKERVGETGLQRERVGGVCREGE